MAETKVKVTGSSNSDHASAMSKPPKPKRTPKEEFPDPPLVKAVLTHLGYGIMIILGHIIDFLRRLGLKSDPYSKAMQKEVCIDLLSQGCSSIKVLYNIIITGTWWSYARMVVDHAYSALFFSLSIFAGPF